MERFTQHTPNGASLILGEPRTQAEAAAILKEQFKKACNCLAELEDAIECRRMVEIPCKIGDTIYVVPSKAVYGLNILHKLEKNNRIYKQVIDEVRITRRGWYLKTCDLMDTQVDSFLGETWFLTEAEAEAKLDELRKSENITFEEPTANKKNQPKKPKGGKP